MPNKGKPLIINTAELAAHKILKTVAEPNGVLVHTKIRVADVVFWERYHLAPDLHSYAMKSHFDFVISDSSPPYRALFAVEIDGASHREPQAIRNDRKKNELCSTCDFPLARVQSPHTHHGERGVDYLTWLVEVYFAAVAIDEFYASGAAPPDAYLDPMMFLSHERIPGKFPLAFGLQNRAHIQVLNRAGMLSSAYATIISATDRSERNCCMAIIQSGQRYAVAQDCVFLWGFGLLSEEAAEEIVLDRLPVLGGKLNDKGWIDSTQLRVLLTTFLRQHRNATLKHWGIDCGFTVTHDWKLRTWVIGEHGRSREFRVTAQDDDPHS